MNVNMLTKTGAFTGNTSAIHSLTNIALLSLALVLLFWVGRNDSVFLLLSQKMYGATRSSAVSAARRHRSSAISSLPPQETTLYRAVRNGREMVVWLLLEAKLEARKGHGAGAATTNLLPPILLTIFAFYIY